MSSFASLGLGARALQAAQHGLDVTGQNISNVSTAGYSRQRLDQVARGGTPVPAMFSRPSGVTGDGVQVRGAERIRDEFLELRAQQARAGQSSGAAVQATYASIEAAFGEPSETGLQAQMSAFWDAWHEVANDPLEGAPRNQLLERAAQLAGSFRRTSGQLTGDWADAREKLRATVAETNRTAADVARLNDAIRSATVSGAPTNELADQRDLLVLRLGERVGAVTRVVDDGTVTVTLGGSSLVTGSRASELAVSGPELYPGSGDTVQVVWKASGQTATVGGGAVGGTLVALNTILPQHLARLDDVAARLAGTVNAQQAAGFDRSGSPGAPIFSGTTAAGLAVTLTGADGIAASSSPPPAYDGDNAGAMAARASDAAGPDAAYRSLIVELGVQSQSATHQAESQSVMLRQVDQARLGVSSVSLDEEMTNLMTYQHAYEAAARYVSVIDATLDALITMTR